MISQDARSVPYSFSMINLVKLMPSWNPDVFRTIMAEAKTSGLEVVPSMLLGPNWDQQNGGESLQLRLPTILTQYEVTSIQSLTYGLDINLAQPLEDNQLFHRRLNALCELGSITDCQTFVLGSPAQKKLVPSLGSRAEHTTGFLSNCKIIAMALSKMGGRLSLEHNTIEQGAEFCNTLEDILECVDALRAAGANNTGINLDTKCLINEYGIEVSVSSLLNDDALRNAITSIQLSFDCASRNLQSAQEDIRRLAELAHEKQIPLSLEEFGLERKNLEDFIRATGFA